MSSHQSGSKRLKCEVDVNLLQDQGDNMSMEVDQHDMAMEVEDDTETDNSKQDINPLQMPLIVGKIHSFSDVESIKNARQVNKLWSAEGAKMLVKKCYVKSPWGILLHKPTRKNKKTFRTFLAHTSRSALMVPNITIADAHDVELWKSFRVLGKHVTSLKLNIVADEADWLCNLLVLLPNLKYLNIKNIKNKHRVITMVLSPAMAKAEIDQNRNPLIISPLELQPVNLLEFGIIENLSNCKNIITDELNISLGPRFLNRETPNLEDRLENIINKLLSTSQNILKKLSMTNCELFLSFLEFPSMKKLKQVKLCFSPHNLGHLNQCQFSPSFQFSELIPSLEHISIYCNSISHHLQHPNFLGVLFETTGTSSSVKCLSYRGASYNFLIDPLFRIFPNVEDFQISGTECSQNLFNTIWTDGKNLRKLHLYFKIKRSMKIPDLDAGFTGITGFTQETTAEKIKRRQQYGIPATLEKWGKYGVNSSILNLNELEHLSIHLSGPGLNGLPEDYLAIAGEFAFQLMPQKPKISIHATYEQLAGIEKALAQVSKFPNVSLVLKKAR